MPSKPPAKTVRPVKTSGNTTGKSGSRRPSEKPSRTISKSRKHSHAHHSRKTSSKWASDKSRTRHVSKKTSSRRRGPKTERHPSSSLGLGVGDPVTIVMLVLGISSIVLFVVGVWLLATQDGWPVGLNNTGNRTWTRFISYGTACIVVSLLFIPILIFIILDASASRGSQARVTRLVVVFISAFLVIVLLLMSVTGIMFAANRPGFIANVIEDAWTKTVVNSDSVGIACEVERDFNCRGWRTNSCLNCNPTVNGVYENCLPLQQLVCPRCFPAAPVQVDSSGQSGTTTVQGTQGTQSTQGTTITQDGVAPVAVQTDGTDQLVQRDIKRAHNGFEWTERQQTQVAVQGCRTPVLRRYRSFFIPMTVYTLFLLLLLLVVSYKACVDSSRRC
ncbi:hypothetical protein FGB62_11g27 [Gracilaria domingensis]|nr:hypothetical protein FGB62_11g27 [Gracilaria domingensis]